MYVSIQERINSMQFESNREMCQGLLDAMRDAIHVPNEMLPEHFQNHKSFEVGSVGSLDGKRYGASGKRIIEKVAKINEENEAKAAREAHEAEKDRRVELYRKQMEFLEEITYEPMVESEININKLSKAFA